MYKGGVYLSMGDSTAWTLPLESQKGLLYTHLIQEAIAKQYGTVKHISKGIGGATSTHLAQNFNWSTLVVPDLVTIGVGMNDVLSGNNISTTLYKSNLEKIIDRLRVLNPDVHIILCTPNRSSDANRSNLPAYRTAMGEVATSKNVSIVNFENAYTDAEISANTQDGIHPNTAAQPKLFNLLWPVVQTGAWLNKLGK